MSTKQDEYHSSHQQLSFIEIAGQHQLHQTSVLVIGAGGLGCPCLQILAGAGVGSIGIADYDTVSISNLHRQYLYNYNDTGKLKTQVAAERLSAYNPFIKVQPHELMVDERNVLELIATYDVIVDGTDNFFTRYLINDACVFLNKPLVYGAIHQTEGHITVFNYNNSPTLRCLFPKDENESIASCAEIGAYNVITNIIGTMMANEVIKIIMKRTDVLAGKLNQVDVLAGKTFQVQYHEVAGSRQKSMERFSTPRVISVISAVQLKEKINSNENLYLIDVREVWEHKDYNIGGLNIPLQQFLNQTAFEFEEADKIVLYCQKGNRSSLAAAHLFKLGFENAVSLQGGMDHWQKISADI